MGTTAYTGPSWISRLLMSSHAELAAAEPNLAQFSFSNPRFCLFGASGVWGA